MNALKAYFIPVLLLAAALTCAAQSPEALEREADTRLKEYDFAAASELYRRAYEASSDEAFRGSMVEKMAQCDNGLNMLSFACKPVVVASRTVPAADFFLYYSHIAAERWGRLEDGSVAALCPSLDRMFFARDNEGQSDIYTSSLIEGDLWSTPSLLGESHISPKDETMPVVSYDGKKLYYSSKGLFGMGGYDLFVSSWDAATGTWSEPQNLGFPFSSVGDDFLYSDTPDGNFSLLASNRDCGPDSVTIYVLQFKNEPLKSSVTAAEASKIAALEVSTVEAPQGEETDETVGYDNPLQRRYAAAMGAYLGVKDSIESIGQRQADLRRRFAAAGDEADRGLLQRNLAAAEQSMFDLQQQLRAAASRLQSVEMECLLNGVAVDHAMFEKPQRQVSAPAVLPSYEFVRIAAPRRLGVVFEEPEEQFDYSFKVLDEAVIADNAALEEGLIYQIQILSGANKLALRQLRGLSPVFEKRQSNGKYIYCVGKFSKYADAQKALPTVRKYFSSAFIVAFRDGKSMSVTNARKAEAEIQDRWQVIFSEYPDGIPAGIMEVIRANCSKDIARRSSEEGKIVYYIAPFDSRTEAEALIARLREAGAKGISSDIIK